MTLYLKPVDMAPQVSDFRSALIVVCRFCPATSLSLQTGQPYMEFFRRFVNTGSYEEYIDDLRQRLEAGGVSVGVFRGNLLNFIGRTREIQSAVVIDIVGVGNGRGIVVSCIVDVEPALDCTAE